MIANPVLLNDLRKSLFRRKPVHVVAYMAMAIVGLTYGIVIGLPFNLLSQYRHVPLWNIPDLLLPVVVPAFAAGSFAKEYEQRTWEDVLLTRLGSWEILRGKFLSSLLPTLTTIIVLFPPFAMLLILQNVRWALDFGPWILIVIIKFLISAFFYIALVMLCSYYGKSGRTSLVSSYVVLAGYVLANYVVWILAINALAGDPDTTSNFGSYYANPMTRGFREATEFQLSLVEIMHCCQSIVFGSLIMLFLRSRLGRRG